MKHVIWCALSCLILHGAAQAASFDCAKAQSNVEKLICENEYLSKLDEELAESYKSELGKMVEVELIKREQRRWLKKRDACPSEKCLLELYQMRIEEFGPKTGQALPRSKRQSNASYVLEMSNHQSMCSYFQRRMNADLQQQGRTFGGHQAFVMEGPEFRAVAWRPVAIFHDAVRTNDESVYGESALFDINNDGVLDYVVRIALPLSGIEADGIYVLDQHSVNQSSRITFQELFGSVNQIQIAGGFYPLSGPRAGDVVPLWRLSPFIYDGATYLYMQSLYRSEDEVGDDRVVIGRYLGGRIRGRAGDSKFDDVCYIRRTKESK